MAIYSQKDCIKETYSFFYTFPLYQANVSKISIDRASHSRNGSTLLHLFDLSHLNLNTRRIFLIDLIDRQKRNGLFLRMAILDNINSYQPVFLYGDDDYFDAVRAEINNSIFLDKIRKNFDFIESDVYKLAIDLAKQQDISLDEFLNDNPIYQSFLALLNNDNYLNILQNDNPDIWNFEFNDKYYPYPEIYIVSPSNTASYKVKKDVSNSLFDMDGDNKIKDEDALFDFYYRILKCVTDDEVVFPDRHFYNYSLNSINYNFAYFTIGDLVYYPSYNTDEFVEKRFADNDPPLRNFNEFQKDTKIAFRDKYKFEVYCTKAKQLLRDYEIENLTKSIAYFNYDDIKNTICKQIDLAASILNKRNEIIKRKIDSFDDVEVI